MLLKCQRRSRAATRLGGSHAKVFYRVRDGRPPEVDHRLRPRRGHRRGRDEEVPRQPLGRDRRVDGWVPRAVARGLRERLPRLRPAKGARRARRRVRRRRGLEDPQVGRRLGLQERQERRRQDGQGDTRLDISPVWIPSPEVEGIRDLAGAYDGATARLATAKQRLLAFLARRGFVYGGTTPAGNPRKYWTYDFLRWLDKVRPEDDGGVRTLAALRNEVEAAAEARADLLSEYRAAVDAVSVNIIFTISTNAFSPIAPTRIRRIRQRGCAAFGA